MLSPSGPGSYNNVPHKFVFKRNPSAVFSTAKRLAENKNSGPDPASYVTTSDIVKPRSNSREKTSMRPVIGNAIRWEGREFRSPGPQSYDTSHIKTIANNHGYNATIGNAIRPISAPRNRLTTETGVTSPGP
jgi:hypothetical protein